MPFFFSKVSPLFFSFHFLSVSFRRFLCPYLYPTPTYPHVGLAAVRFISCSPPTVPTLREYSSAALWNASRDPLADYASPSLSPIITPSITIRQKFINALPEDLLDYLAENRHRCAACGKFAAPHVAFTALYTYLWPSPVGAPASAPVEYEFECTHILCSSTCFQTTLWAKLRDKRCQYPNGSDPHWGVTFSTKAVNAGFADAYEVDWALHEELPFEAIV